MVSFIWSEMTPLVIMAALIALTSGLPTSTNNTTSRENSTSAQPGFHLESITPQSKEDCLFDQYYDEIKQVCETCTYCPPGTEHDSREVCGYGEGENTSCIPCRMKGINYYQPHRGHYGLVCRGCITCDPHADILRNCSTTHNAKCGPCHAGFFTYAPNWCLPCTEPSDHSECASVQSDAPSSVDQSFTLTDGPNPGTPSDTSTDIPCTTENDVTPTRQVSAPNGGPKDESRGSQVSKVGSVFRDGGALIILVIFIAVLCLGHYINSGKQRKGSSTTANRASIKRFISQDQPAIPSVSGGEAQRLAEEVIAEPSSSTQQERVSLLGSSVGPSTDDESRAPSSPGLSTSGGNVRTGVESLYPNLAMDCLREPSFLDESFRVPGSPNSAKVNFSFEGDEGNCTFSSPR